MLPGWGSKVCMFVSVCGEFCEAEDSGNATVVEHCRLFGLPDLNQSVPYVRDELIGWITGLIAEFHFDGIRIDTMPYVPIVSTKPH